MRVVCVVAIAGALLFSMTGCSEKTTVPSSAASGTVTGPAKPPAPPPPVAPPK